MSYFLCPQLISLLTAAKTVSQQKKGQNLQASVKLLVHLRVTLSWLEPKACFPTQYAFPMSRENRAAAFRSAPAGTRHHTPLWRSPIFAETAARFGTQTWHLPKHAALLLFRQ